MNEKENNKTITPEQIESWKKKWGDVFCVTVGDKMAYLKRPSRQALSAAAVVGKNDPMKYNEILLNNCWLAGGRRGNQDGRCPVPRRIYEAGRIGGSEGSRAKKIISRTGIADRPGWLLLADSLIRAYLHIDPATLGDEEWGLQVVLAEWVKYDFIKSMGDLWQTR